MQSKRIPERRCVGCGESFPKNSLIRVVRTPEGEVKLDFTGKLNGRGAYVCKKSECFRLARKKRRLSTNLDVQIPDDVLDALEREIERAEKEEVASS